MFPMPAISDIHAGLPARSDENTCLHIKPADTYLFYQQNSWHIILAIVCGCDLNKPA